eukprot:gene12494-6242_t
MQNLRKLKEESRLQNESGNSTPNSIDSPMVAVQITQLQKNETKKQRKRSFLPTTKPRVSVETSFSVPITVEENETDQRKPTKRRVSRLVQQLPQIEEEEEVEKKPTEEKDISARNKRITQSRRTRSVSQAKQLEDALTVFESFKSTLKLAEETRKIRKPENIRKRMKKVKKEETPQPLSISVPQTSQTSESQNSKVDTKKEQEKKLKPQSKHVKTKSNDLSAPNPVGKQSSLNNFLNKALKPGKNPSTKDEEETLGGATSLAGFKPTTQPEPKKRGLFGSLFKKKKKAETPPPPPNESALKESGGMLGVTRFIRTAVSLNKKRFNEGGFDLDLSYITPQLIAMGYPSSGLEGAYRNPVTEVQEFFESRHPGKYKLYNLCEERNYDPELFKGRVENFGFADHNPPPLFIMKPIMQNIREWIKHDGNVAVIHCKAGKGRTGTVIAAYLMDCGLCDNAEEAMEFFGLKRTKDGKGVTIPSQRRYVHYYDKCLKYGFPKIDKKLILDEIKWSGPIEESCAPNFKLFYLGKEIYDFSTKIVGELKEFDPEDYSSPIVFLLGGPVIVKGDIKVGFFFGKEKKVKFHFWFNTNMIDQGNHLVLNREELDGGVKKDKKCKVYPLDFAISVRFKNV